MIQGIFYKSLCNHNTSGEFVNQEPRQWPKAHRLLTPNKSAKAYDSSIDNLRLIGFVQPANRLPLVDRLLV